MIEEFEIYRPGTKQSMPAFNPNAAFSHFSDYIVSPPLKNALNVALMLGQPLLLTGEPGTGKTQLAYHLAKHYSANGQPENFFIFNTKSTSTAKDLFYTYDSLQHFQYVQNQGSKVLSPEEIEEKFIRYQALGAAIKSGKRCIVLMDEIDKAPRDFPNDILDVLEDLEFEVPEINRIGANSIKTNQQNRPIIIMTSNSEKSLPDAFLRRCVFYHIPFPDKPMLLNILASKNTRYSSEEQGILVDHFNTIREIVKKKKPSTAELLFWVSILEKIDFNVFSLKNPEVLRRNEKELLVGSYSALAKNQEDVNLILKTLF